MPRFVVSIVPLDPSEVTKTVERRAVSADVDPDAIPETRPSMQSAAAPIAADVDTEAMLIEIESVAAPSGSDFARPGSPSTPAEPASSRVSRSSIPPPLPPAASRVSRSSIAPPLPPASSRVSRSSLPPPLPPAALRASRSSLPPPLPPAPMRASHATLVAPASLPDPSSPSFGSAPVSAGAPSVPLPSSAPAQMEPSPGFGAVTVPMPPAPPVESRPFQLALKTDLDRAPAVNGAPVAMGVGEPLPLNEPPPAMLLSGNGSPPADMLAPRARLAMGPAFTFGETPSVSPVAMSVSLGHRARFAGAPIFRGRRDVRPSLAVIVGIVGLVGAGLLAVGVVVSVRYARGHSAASGVVEQPIASATSALAFSSSPAPVATPAVPAIAPVTPLPSVAVEALPKLVAEPDMTLVTLPASAKGHRVFVDGRVVGTGPSSLKIKCGMHKVQIGSAGKPRVANLPCGGELTLD